MIPYIVLQVVGLVIGLIVIVVLVFVGTTIIGALTDTSGDGKKVAIGIVAMWEFLLIGSEGKST